VHGTLVVGMNDASHAYALRTEIDHEAESEACGAQTVEELADRVMVESSTLCSFDARLRQYRRKA